MTNSAEWWQGFVEFPRHAPFGVDFEVAAIGPPRKTKEEADGDLKPVEENHDSLPDWKKVPRKYFSKKIWPITIV